MAGNISSAKAIPRGKIAALTRAVRNGERQPDDPELRAARCALALANVTEEAEKLAEKARQLVADWPELEPEKLDRLAGILTVTPEAAAG